MIYLTIILKIMYLKSFKNFTLILGCFRTGQALRREEYQHEIREGRFRNLNFSPSTKKTIEYYFELFLPINRYYMFFLSLQATNEFQNTSSSKATVVMRFPARKNAGCPKAPRNFPPRKDGILHPPVRLPWDSLPIPQSLYGRTGV